MTELQAVFLGIVQGLTEFLPVSSSGHLIFIPQFLGWADQGLAFDVMVHLGTLFAVVIYFRKKLWAIICAVCSLGGSEAVRSDRRLGWFIALSIIPAGVVGFFFGDAIEEIFRSATVIGWGLIGWGVVLYVADLFARHTKERKELMDFRWTHALIIGMAQAIALIPGTSRSGITITAGLFSKFTKKAAAEFSFLMSVPIIALAGILKMVQLSQEGLGDLQVSVLVVGCLSAAFSGFVAIWGLLKIIERWSFLPFALYRVCVGILILLFL
jgi:undecaprenyl-diphosphatase